MHDERFAEVHTSLTPSLFAVPSMLAFADPLPHLPMMIATRLQLELLMQEPSLDLRAVSEVILSDAGATLQILRLIGEEYPDDEDRPTRIEDCIVSLSRERWYEAVCCSGMSNSEQLTAEWHRCRRLAECAREVARCIDGISPEEAYLVGLLHRLGTFPHLLGWKRTTNTQGEHDALSLMLADYWHLPAYLLSAIREQQEPAITARWNELLEVAQQLAEQPVMASGGGLA